MSHPIPGTYRTVRGKPGVYQGAGSRWFNRLDVCCMRWKETREGGHLFFFYSQIRPQ